jgi:hypothetical protein
MTSAGSAPARVPPPTPFIVGVGRSGTTLLRMMLDSHPELSIPPETNFFRALRKGLPGQRDPRGFFLKTVAVAQQRSDFGFTTAELERRVRAIQPFDLASALRALYLLYASRFGKKRWGDKTPTNLPEMEMIQRVLPEARFIHVVRDGRDVALSLKEVWFGPDTFRECAEAWVWAIEQARRQRPALRHYVEVRFETLVREPETTLREVCGFLDLPWAPSMLAYHQRAAERLEESCRDYVDPGGRLVATGRQRIAALRRTAARPDAGRIGRWRTEMNAQERDEFHAVAAETLRGLGYEVE